jgi:hypothetical protein
MNKDVLRQIMSVFDLNLFAVFESPHFFKSTEKIKINIRNIFINTTPLKLWLWIFVQILVLFKKFSPYLTVNTLHHLHKDQPLKDRNYRSLLWDWNERDKYIVWAKCRVLRVKTSGRYNYHCVTDSYWTLLNMCFVHVPYCRLVTGSDTFVKQSCLLDVTKSRICIPVWGQGSV